MINKYNIFKNTSSEEYVLYDETEECIVFRGSYEECKDKLEWCIEYDK